MAQDFMQYQMQQSGDPRMRRKRPPQPQGQPVVMPNGQPQPAAPATQPTSPQAPAAPPAQPQPPTGMEGWQSYGDGGWAPPNHPAANQAAQQQANAQQQDVDRQQDAQIQQQYQQPQQPNPYRQNHVIRQPAEQYMAQITAPPTPMAPGQQGGVNAQGVYTAGQAPTQTYAPQQVQQFSAPDMNGIQAPTNQLLQQLLANPQTMTPQVIDQLKGREQDAASLMEQQMMGNISGKAAARGLSPNSNYIQGQMRDVTDSTNRGLLSSYRDIDINAIGQNRQDMMEAIGAGDAAQNSALQRAIGSHQATLQGTGEQRAENALGLDSQMNQFQAQQGAFANQANSLQQAIAGNRQFGLNQGQLDLSRDQFGFNQEMGRGELGLNRELGIGGLNLNRELGRGNLALGQGQLGVAQGQLGLQGQELRQRGSEFDQNLGFQRDQFNYGKEQNALQAQQAAQARGDANTRWADSQAMQYQQQQEADWNNLMALLMGGGGGF